MNDISPYYLYYYTYCELDEILAVAYWPYTFDVEAPKPSCLEVSKRIIRIILQAGELSG